MEKIQLTFLIRGILIGFSIAAPVGPIGVLCIRRTLNEGRVSGLVSGLGAASADAIYGCIAGFGLTFISSFLVDHHILLRMIGGMFLCYLGIRTICTKPAEQTAFIKGNGLLKSYTSTLFLTLTNPMTILSFSAVFAGLGLAETRGDYAIAGTLVLGVFLGSFLWWLILSNVVGFLQTKLKPEVLRWVNRITGITITLFGMIILMSLI